MLNANSQDDVLKRLEPFKLDGVVQKISCPFLMLHGEGDEQIPLSEAQKCFDAVGSKDKTMKIFTREEGGYHHCQIDNQSICSAYMWDWLEQVLQPARVNACGPSGRTTYCVDLNIVVADDLTPALNLALHHRAGRRGRALIFRECREALVRPGLDDLRIGYRVL